MLASVAGFHEAKREFDHVTETRRHDLAVLYRDALDLHDKRALARHAPFSGVIPSTVPIRVALMSVLNVHVHRHHSSQLPSSVELLRCSGSDPAAVAP